MKRAGSVADEIRRDQGQANRNAARCEALYAGHRAALTRAILETGGGGTLCLLGAGNCLDVDLEALAARFDRVHLVDLDAAALERAVARQTEGVRARLVAHAGVDLTGMLASLDRWRASAPTLAELDALVAPGVQAIVDAVGGPFSVVASCCVATQMSRALTLALGETHPALADVRRRVVTVHLRALAALAAGGKGLFASDLTSNETYPLDALPAEADLGAVQSELVRTGNFFFGADPTLHQQLLRRDAVLAKAVRETRGVPPWLWRISEERVLLVYALALTMA